MPKAKDTFEERKAREDEFFKECEESGNYSVYEELEFERPLKGLTEEIVLEEKIVEESTKVHQNFDPRKNVKVTIK